MSGTCEIGFRWWARQDSNLHLTGYESAALTVELRAHWDRRAIAAPPCAKQDVASRDLE